MASSYFFSDIRLLPLAFKDSALSFSLSDEPLGAGAADALGPPADFDLVFARTSRSERREAGLIEYAVWSSVESASTPNDEEMTSTVC